MDAIEQMIGPSTNDPRAMWRAALAEPDRRKRPPVDMNHPEEGFYRFKRQGRWVLLKLMYEDGELYGLEGVDTWLSLDEILEVFSWAWDNPISEETYNLVIAGGDWPDLDKAVEQQMRPRGAGDNRPPEDERDQILIDIENALPAVETYKDISSEEMSTAAQSARARLNELARKADKRREALAAPAIAAQREINGKWKPLVEAATAAAKAIGRAMGTWEDKKAALERERERERQRQAKAEQDAADRAIAKGTPPSEMEAPIAEAPAPGPAPNTTIKGGYGRAASVQVVKEPTITDQDTVYRRYRDRQELRDLLLKWVRIDVNNGHTIEGVTVEEKRKVR